MGWASEVTMQTRAWTGGAALPPTHLLDATMFWNPRGGGGVRRYVMAKRAWLAREKRWRTSLVAPGARGAGAIDCGGVPLPFSGGYRMPLDRRALAQAIEHARPDLIEAGDPFIPAWAALDAAERLTVPAVAFCHGNPMAMAAHWAGGLARPAAARYLARVYRDFDLVLAPSRSMRGALEAIGVKRVEEQPLGVDATLFHPARRDAAWRTSLGLSSAQRVLVYAGRFAPEKHLGVLAAAVRRLGARYVLVAVGHGPAPPRGAQVLRLPFEPRPTRLARILASADGFVHAGDQETFGLAALEAMACGTPCALRAAAGLAELIEGDAGIAVASNRAEDWAQAIEGLFDPSTCQRRIAIARERAQGYDWPRVFEALLARYQRLLLGRELHVGEITALASAP
jgi:alpha-1,6-mannosyltransferase